MTPDVQSRFNNLVGELDYPMFIAPACNDASQRAGCLIGFATQSSIDPSRFLICLSKANRTYRVARTASVVAVHFVPASAGALAELFGGRTGDETDKFAECEWREGPGGVPVLSECRNWFAGAVVDRFDLGDHVGFLLDPVEVQLEVAQGQFNFHRARRIDAGHEA